MDHAVLEPLVTPAPECRVHIGLIKPATPTQHIGKLHHSCNRKGFGLDASPAFVAALTEAMYRLECRTKFWLFNFGPPARVVRSEWASKIKCVLVKAPRVVTAHVPYKYRRIYFFTHAEFVLHCEHLLIPQWVPPEYRLDYLRVAQPTLLPEHPGREVPGWRYQIMAKILVHDLLPNLRTSEMVEPNGVWRRLNEYFWNVQNLNGRWTYDHPRALNRDRQAFALAVYHQVVLLLYEQWHRTESYRQAVAERQPMGCLANDPIMVLPPPGNNDRPTIPHETPLAEAQRIRTIAYDDLLLALLANCHTAVLRCD